MSSYQKVSLLDLVMKYTIIKTRDVKINLKGSFRKKTTISNLGCLNITKYCTYLLLYPFFAFIFNSGIEKLLSVYIGPIYNYHKKFSLTSMNGRRTQQIAVST